MNKRLVIEGEKLHHIGYRPFILAKARRLKIRNYEAENLVENGREKIVVSFGGDEKQVQSFVEFIKTNYPPEAKVSSVREVDAPEYVMSIDEYDKILSAEQQNTVVQTGMTMVGLQKDMLGTQKDMLGKQDQMLGKQDQMLGKQDQMLGKQDQMLEKQDKTVETLDTFRKETNQNFTTLNTKYDKISRDIALAVQGIEKVVKNTEKDRKSFEKSIDKIVSAILKLAKSRS